MLKHPQGTVLTPILWPRPISISASPGTVKWSFELIFLWIMIMFMFFYIFLYCRMYNYMYLCTNKGKNITKITIRLMIPIFRILRLAMSTNFTQNWRKQCTYLMFVCVFVVITNLWCSVYIISCYVVVPIILKGKSYIWKGCLCHLIATCQNSLVLAGSPPTVSTMSDCCIVLCCSEPGSGTAGGGRSSWSKTLRHQSKAWDDLGGSQTDTQCWGNG